MIEINLLKERRKDLIKQHGLARERDKISYIVLTAGVAIFLVLQAARIGMMMALNNTDMQIKKTEATIKDFREVEAELREVGDRAAEINKVLEGRELLKEKLAVVAAIFGKGTALDKIGFGGVTQGNSLVISGTAQSIFDLVDFTDRLEQLAVDQDFEAVEQTSLSRNVTGAYNFTYELAVSSGKVAQPATKKNDQKDS